VVASRVLQCSMHVLRPLAHFSALPSDPVEKKRQFRLKVDKFF